MKKKSGSILLECIVSIFIITILCGVVVKMNKLDLKAFVIREESRKNNIILNNIISELKFNISINELDKIFNKFEENIFINLNDANKLKDENIINLFSNFNSKSFIKISKIFKNDKEIKMSISLTLNDEKFLETEILKEYWMELK